MGEGMHNKPLASFGMKIWYSYITNSYKTSMPFEQKAMEYVGNQFYRLTQTFENDYIV